MFITKDICTIGLVYIVNISRYCIWLVCFMNCNQRTLGSVLCSDRVLAHNLKILALISDKQIKLNSNLLMLTRKLSLWQIIKGLQHEKFRSRLCVLIMLGEIKIVLKIHWYYMLSNVSYIQKAYLIIYDY